VSPTATRAAPNPEGKLSDAARSDADYAQSAKTQRLRPELDREILMTFDLNIPGSGLGRQPTLEGREHGRAAVPPELNRNAGGGQFGDLLVPVLAMRTGIRIALAKDEEVYGQGEEAEFFYRILHGAVRTSHYMSDGRRQIGDFYREGDMFGFETRPQHRFSAEALQDSVVLVLKRSALKGAGGQFERLVEASIDRELERAQEHLFLLGCKSACEKMASFLLDCVRDAVGECVELPMSRQDIADYLALSIETVSRMLSQLRESRIVLFSSKRCFRVIDPTALAELAEAPFRSIQNRSRHGHVVAEWRSFGDVQRQSMEQTLNHAVASAAAVG
jgi:CRP/FNR family nitrogen fixation transcriptional regulator